MRCCTLAVLCWLCYARRLLRARVQRGGVLRDVVPEPEHAQQLVLRLHLHPRARPPSPSQPVRMRLAPEGVVGVALSDRVLVAERLGREQQQEPAAVYGDEGGEENLA